MAPTNGYDLIRWANRTAKIPSDRYIGVERVRRILVDLALNSDRHWTTYVSRRRLADDLDIDQRIVGRALTLLANSGLIMVTERDGRGMTRWRLWPEYDVPTGGDSTLKRGDSITPEFGDSTPFGGETGGATGGATGGDSTHPHLYKDRDRGGDRTRAHARTHAREAADGPPSEDQPPPTPAAHGEQPAFDPYTWSPWCDRHPGGTAEACRACQHRATQYELARGAWVKTRCIRDGCSNPIDQADPSYRLCTRHVALRGGGQ